MYVALILSISGKLPNHAEILGYLLYCQQNDPNKKLAAYEVSKDLVFHWMCCNIYTINLHHVKNKIEKMVNEYIRLRNYPKKKWGNQFWENHSDFKILLSSLMDINEIKINYVY